MPDLSIYKVNLDTPQPEGRKGESPRVAFTKYNDLISYLEGNTGSGVSLISDVEPTETFAFIEWIDTSTTPAMIKRRNRDNTSWLTIGSYEKPLTDFVEKVTGKGLSTNDYTNEDKQIVSGVTQALEQKVDKVVGKGLSTNDYTNEDKQIVGGVTQALEQKVDKVVGKGLSTNDYTNEDKQIVGGVTESINQLQNSTTQALEQKVDKVADKGLSTNDYANADKSLVSALLSSGLFKKSIRDEPAFMISGGQLKTACNIAVIVDGQLLTFGTNETITTPTLLLGVDYAIYATADGLIVSSNFTFPDGYNAENSRRIGGFHYGNNEYKPYSFYDLNFRPKCKDPRGMVIDISGSSFWADIYLLNTTPDALGTSAYNATIADGASPPKIPSKWGGNGTSQYPNFTRYIATEVLAAFGKRLPNAHEFSVFAQGSTTGYVAGSDPVTTKFDASARSLIGCEQVSGHMWQWGSEQWDRGNGSSGYGWYVAETGGKGGVYSALSGYGVGASLFGGFWADSGQSGSRCSLWEAEPWDNTGSIAARGICDHFQQS
ncbi:hypothetical protein FXE96_09745 [Vibrio cholerae]|uniref:phage major tropism determinant n=1 Tax=Vibrio cholerae TaxID=666 RepID=UPI0011D4EF72|nr:hypothetical protein [Vibrio cholerae]TXX76085.1 hypothetical protein FXE96_09745 [Vibrio cholerae]GIA27444.1 Phage tail fiber [Vibrio cholerae]